ncbi:MAG: menaquinone biosynthesis protein [Saprospiraceae bacterium]|nr:menaquinone biosynthesis protein [Saprospiraceae bacterium]
MEKYRGVAVNYLNTKPMLWGLVKSGLEKEMELKLAIPSLCSEMLTNGSVDFGLIPIASIPTLNSPYLISDYCIGTNGKVRTVCLVANEPIEQLKLIHLDHHSRTSKELIRILLDEYWKLNIPLVQAKEGFENNIPKGEGALVIGDKMINIEKKYSHIYDLGEIWKSHTGLPFVFAAWVSNKPLDEEFIDKMNDAFSLGINSLNELDLIMPAMGADFDISDYFRNNISYDLDNQKIKAMQLFLGKLGCSEHYLDHLLKIKQL